MWRLHTFQDRPIQQCAETAHIPHPASHGCAYHPRLTQRVLNALSSSNAGWHCLRGASQGSAGRLRTIMLSLIPWAIRALPCDHCCKGTDLMVMMEQGSLLGRESRPWHMCMGACLSHIFDAGSPPRRCHVGSRAASMARPSSQTHPGHIVQVPTHRLNLMAHLAEH